MSKGTLVLAAVMGTLLMGSVYASTKGIGVPQPDKEPPSIREGSTAGRINRSGHHGTRFFLIGGGPFYGK